MKTGITVFVYAAIVLLGGIVGYIKAHSLPSLWSSIIFAALLSISAFATIKGYVFGFYASIALTIILFGFFANRFAQNFKFMPAGLMCILSMLVFICLVSNGWRKD